MGLFAAQFHPAMTLFALLGALGTAGGVSVLSGRVVVDECGIRKSPSWLGGFHSRWEDIESWSLRPLDFDAIGAGDSLTFRAIVLRVRERRWPVEITDSEAHRPRFDELVELL